MTATPDTATETAAPTVDTAAAPSVPTSPGTEMMLRGHDVPARLADQLALAEAICRTNLMPPACRTAAGVLATQRAAVAFNLPFWVVAQAMHVVDGKVGWDASFIRGLVNRAGHRCRIIERSSEKATVRIVRSDDPVPYDATFTIEDARTAEMLEPDPDRRDGRVKKDNWRKYPAAMLVARATTIAVRDHCPEVLMGAGYTPEELGADTDEDGVPVVTIPAERIDTQPTVERVTANAEQVREQWRRDIEECSDPEAVQALYERAKRVRYEGGTLLDRPLHDDGTTVEAALARRAAELRAAAEVHDAEVVPDEELAAAPSAVDEPVDVTPEPDEPAPVPDSPELCRNSAARRGVLKHLAEGGDIDALIDVEFGLPVAQVSTRRLLDLARRLGGKR